MPHSTVGRTALASALIVLLAACGQGGPAAPRMRASLAPVLVGSPIPVRPSATPVDAVTQQRVAAALARLDSVKTLVGKVVFDEAKPGSDTEHGEAKFTFRHQPFAARVDVLTSNRWFANGATILWSGGNTLRVRPPHVPLSLTFDYDDDKVVSLRGYRIDQTDIFSMGKVLRAPGTAIAPLGPRRIQGEDLYMLEVRSPASLPGVTRELIGLSNRIQIPTYREMYAGEMLVHKGQGLGVKLDIAVEGDLFDI